MDINIKISGIYKITSPTGRIYIGSSKDVYYRRHQYEIKHCKEQPRLYRSLLKYGFENHIFEILEECSIENLYPLERAWGDFYNVLSRNIGLNCSLPGYGELKVIFSNESILKMSNSSKNISDQTRLKMSKSQKGKKLSEEHKQKISLSHKGKIQGSMSEEQKLKISLSNKGRTVSEETRNKMSLSTKRKPKSEEHRKNILIAQQKRRELEKLNKINNL